MKMKMIWLSSSHDDLQCIGQRVIEIPLLVFRQSADKVCELSLEHLCKEVASDRAALTAAVG